MAAKASIIVRTFNEERLIERLFKGIQGQNFKESELVLVDSGSTDGTVEIACRFGADIVRMSAEEFTFGRSLNLGCGRAKGDFLVFVSGHTYPSSNNWLANLLSPFDDPTIGMVYGRQKGVETTRIPEERDFEQNMFGDMSKILVDQAFGNNGNAAIRRELWLEQPFDETLTGLEDIDWARRIQRKGRRVYYEANAVIYHVHQEDLRQIYRRYRREGIAYRKIFPSSRYGLGSLVRDSCVSSAKDLIYGVENRRSIAKLAQVFPTRVAEFLGTYRGMNHHRMLSSELRQQLYYPKTNVGVVVQAPGEHVVADRGVPALREDEVLVRVAFVGICSTDLEVMNGQLGYYKNGTAKFPVVPGHEYSGVVLDTGRLSNGLKCGDKVVGECVVGCGKCEPCGRREYSRCPSRKEVGVLNMDGAYSELLKLPGRYVHKLPPNVPLISAALVEPLAVCLKGIRKLSVVPGRSAGVIGAGPLGNLCAQAMKYKGLMVAAIDENPSRRRVVGRYGIDTWADLEPLGRFDYVIEATGSEAVLKTIVERSKASAKILILGLPHLRPVEVVFSSVVCYEKEIYGSIASDPEDWEEAIGLMSAGAIDVEDFTQCVLPLEQYEEAWRLHQEGQHLKVLLNVTPQLSAM